MPGHACRVWFRSFALGGVLLFGACSQKAENATEEPAGPVQPTAAGSPAPTEFCDLTERYEPVGECERFHQQYEALDAGIDAFKPDEKMLRGKAKIVRYAIKRLPEEVQGENGEIATPDPVPSETPSPTDPAVSPDVTGDPATGITQEQIDAAVEQTGEEVAGTIVADAAMETVQTGRVKIGRLMYACLEGDPIFKIEPAACQTLDTLEQPEPVWQWNVTATERGNDFELRLRSGIEVQASDGSARRIGQPVRRAEIDVDVDGPGKAKDMFDRLAEWLGTPLGAIAALTTLLIALAGVRAAWKRFARGDGGKPG